MKPHLVPGLPILPQLWFSSLRRLGLNISLSSSSTPLNELRGKHMTGPPSEEYASESPATLPLRLPRPFAGLATGEAPGEDPGDGLAAQWPSAPRPPAPGPGPLEKRLLKGRPSLAQVNAATRGISWWARELHGFMQARPSYVSLLEVQTEGANP
eukprot:CAMPEP_0168492866 /NCGR_PEP_ID=MMETSP0228-20121227/70433_1 /TAXON_ID=133427 /ORGANISM="Protoceratium reticulatum, Strain CCCM 535 (=CCMP 1889)" /LENGTH=154 /DNA_ID=CAMNT_0008509649 /DNA_START=724 /DNA_END=1187 /DNA_ORIENTATION=+